MTVRRRVEEEAADGGVFAPPPPPSASSGPFFPPLSPSPVDPFFFSRHQVVSPGRTARPVESLIRRVSCVSVLEVFYFKMLRV